MANLRALFEADPDKKPDKVSAKPTPRPGADPNAKDTEKGKPIKPVKDPEPELQAPLMKVLLKDFEQIRQKYTVNIIGGANPAAYPKLVPKGEIWIEQTASELDQLAFLLHELIEFGIMTKGEKSYAVSHGMAQKLEKVFRSFKAQTKVKLAPGTNEEKPKELVDDSKKKLEETVTPKSDDQSQKGWTPPATWLKYKEKEEAELKGANQPKKDSIVTVYHVTNRPYVKDIKRDGFLGGWGDAGYGVYFWTTFKQALEFAKQHGWDKSLKQPVILSTQVKESQVKTIIPQPTWANQQKYDYIVWHPIPGGEPEKGDDTYRFKPSEIKEVSEKKITKVTETVDAILGRAFPTEREKLPAKKPEPDMASMYEEIGLTPRETGMLGSTDITVSGKTRSMNNNRGKPISSTKEGVESFWKWFGDSKIVDDEERPLVLYHGTRTSFSQFKTARKKSANRMGAYFTDRPDVNKAISGRGFTQTMPVYLVMNKPFDVRNVEREEIAKVAGLGHSAEFEIRTQGRAGKYKTLEWLDNHYDLVPRLRGKGYDGIIFDDEIEGTTYVIFQPTQVKSAIGNKGTFNPASPKISEAEKEPKWGMKGGRFITPEHKKKKKKLGHYEIYKSIPTNPPQVVQVAQGISEGVFEDKKLSDAILNNDESVVISRFTLLMKPFMKSGWKLYLFGSRAAGTADPDSDYDFALVPVKFIGMDYNNLKVKLNSRFSWYKDNIDIQVMSEKELRLISGDDITLIYKAPINVSESVNPDPTFVAVAKGENEHPDGLKKGDFDWKNEKSYPIKNLLHLMPGGVAGWKDWFSQELKFKPGEWDKLSETKEITDPVVVSPGHIWDGWHRVAAAVINGIATVPAVVGTKK